MGTCATASRDTVYVSLSNDRCGLAFYALSSRRAQVSCSLSAIDVSPWRPICHFSQCHRMRSGSLLLRAQLAWVSAPLDGRLVLAAIGVMVYWRSISRSPEISSSAWHWVRSVVRSSRSARRTDSQGGMCWGVGAMAHRDSASLLSVLARPIRSLSL